MRGLATIALCTLSLISAHDPTADLEWVSGEAFLHGTGFDPAVKGNFYDRLPAAAQATVRSPLWSLSRDSAGMFLQFQTNSSALSVNVTYVYSGSNTMWHFPATGVAGMDLYAFDTPTARWRWVSTTKNNGQVNCVNALATLQGSTAGCALVTYRLHLPLYNGVSSLQLGFNSGATLQADPSYSSPPPVVWYGTSIAQGGVVTRPGMAFTNIISRNISREVLNFGFSGNGLMELNVSQWLVEIDASLFVIDCSWNMHPDLIKSNTVPLVTSLRAKHPTVPIVLVEDTDDGTAWPSAARTATQAQKRSNLHDAFQQLQTAGDENIHYVKAASLYDWPDTRIADDPNHIINPTVGGCHPSDLGQKAMADYYATFLPDLLKTQTRTSFQLAEVSVRSAPAPATGRATAQEQADHDRVLADMTTSQQAQFGLGVVVDYTDVETSDLVVVGRAFNDTAAYFNRLPSAAKDVVRTEVWDLSLMNTGMFVPFVTDAPSIALNVTLDNAANPLWHMPASGTSGADLFCLDPTSNQYRFIAAVSQFPSAAGVPLQLTLTSGLDAGTRQCLLFLPLRNTLTSLGIGVLQGYSVTKHPDFTDGVTMNGKKPIVWYGTSIVQGAAACRPGATYTNVLTRTLERVVLNFGFAGQGRMETSVQGFLNQVDAALFVIDCLPNLNAAQVTNLTAPLVKSIRAAHPTTAILLVAGSTYGSHWFNPSGNDSKRAALLAEYKKLSDADSNLHLMLNLHDELFAFDELENPTVGGTHPSDLGMREIATFYSTYLRQFLDEQP